MPLDCVPGEDIFGKVCSKCPPGLAGAFMHQEALPAGPLQLHKLLSEKPQTARGLWGGVEPEVPWP